MAGSYSVRDNLLFQIKDVLVKNQLWERYQAEIMILGIEVPEIVTQSNKTDSIKAINKLKDFCLNMPIAEKEFGFFKEELYEIVEMSQIFTYERKETSVSAKELKSLIQLGYGEEGVIGIPHKYNFEQAKFIVRQSWKATGKVKFYISREKMVVGNIVAAISEFPQRISIAKVLEYAGDNSTIDDTTKLILYGENYNRKYWNTVSELESEFYLYRFITKEGQESILFTPQKQELGEKIVTGMSTLCNDAKALTENAKINTKLLHFFAQTIESRIGKLRDTDELREYMKERDIDFSALNKYPFSYLDNEKKKIFRMFKYPEWYMRLIWAFLLHSKKGIGKNKYPVHLLILGDRGSGKSTIMELLHEKTKETSNMFSGSSSTLKRLIPSFKSTPPQAGYLAECSRFAFCDEFFRCLMRDKNTDVSQKEDQLSLLNDLLEHKKREAGSGNGNLNVNMNARVMATTNPVKDVDDMNSLLKNFDHSFVSRWLVLFQDKDMVRMAREADELDLPAFRTNVSEIEFLTIIDFLQSFEIEGIDSKRIMDIFEKPKSLFSENVMNHYMARHKHHIVALFDGIVKHRCVIANDMSFEPIEDDYISLENIWKRVVMSWFTHVNLHKIDITQRIDYMPEDCQYVFWKMAEAQKALSFTDIKELTNNNFSSRELNNHLILLRDNDLITEVSDSYQTYLRGRILNENENLIARRTIKGY